MKHPLASLALTVLALAAVTASAQPYAAPRDTSLAAPVPAARLYFEPFAYPPSPDPGPQRSYPGLFLFAGSTALANALVVAGGAHSDALAAGGVVFGVLSLVASLDARTTARPAHFIVGVATITLSLMNISNAPDTYGPSDVESAAAYKGEPVGFSLNF